MSLVLDQLREKIFSKFHKDTWEIRTLGEIATEIIAGSEITKEQLNTGKCEAIKYIGKSTPLQITNGGDFVDLNLIKKKKYCEKGDILFAKFNRIQEIAGKSAVYLGEEKCLAGAGVIILKHYQNPKYLAYVLSTEAIRKQMNSVLQESTVFQLYPKNLKQIKIPLPSLEIQQEIVEFLDRFLELERELEMRKKQYEYYKNFLINRGIKEQNWPLKTIGDIALEIISGNDVRKDQLGSGDFPSIRIKEIYDSPLTIEECINFVDPNLIKRKKYCEYGDILLASASENLRDFGKACVYLGKDRCLIGNDIKIIKHSQNPKFLTYCFSTEEFLREIKRYSTGVKVLHLNTSKFSLIKVPVPPLEIQSALVEKLDLLFKIIYNFKEGIPLQIQKNRERYEFYRELILNKYS